MLLTKNVWFFLSLLCLTCTIYGCSEKKIRLYYTHSGMGYLEPCECPKARLGGMPRRATFLKEQRAKYPDLLLVDAGNFLYPDTNNMQNVLMMSMMAKQLSYDAINVAEYDFSSKQRLVSPPCLSSNVKNAKDSLVTYRLIEKSGLKILVVGVTSLSSLNNASPNIINGLSIQEPLKAIGHVLQVQSADVIVVLVHSVDFDLEKQIALLYPSVNVIISTTIGAERKGEAFVLNHTIITGMEDGADGIGELELLYDDETKITTLRSHQVFLLSETTTDDSETKEAILNFDKKNNKKNKL